MPDWIDKLQDDINMKQQRDDEQAQEESRYGTFISSHGVDAWRELMGLVDSGCKRIQVRGGNRTTCIRGDDKFIVSGGRARLEVIFDFPTRAVSWELMDANEGGRLLPDQRGNEFVYKKDDGKRYTVPEAADFLLRKVFGL